MKPKVYLAGGMGSGWQDQVKKSFEGKFNLFSPRDHQLIKPCEYTTWDLFHIFQCDILFGYMEQDNPSGFGLALEIGYAKALGKIIILIDERSLKDDAFKTRFQIVRESATNVYDNLDDGINFLERFSVYSHQ